MCCFWMRNSTAIVPFAGLLGRHNSITTNEIIDSDVLSTMVTLISSLKHKNQLAGLAVISGLALSSEAAARKLLTAEVLKCLKVCARHHSCGENLWLRILAPKI